MQSTDIINFHEFQGKCYVMFFSCGTCKRKQNYLCFIFFDLNKFSYKIVHIVILDEGVRRL